MLHARHSVALPDSAQMKEHESLLVEEVKMLKDSYRREPLQEFGTQVMG